MRNKLKEANKTLEGKVKELEEKLTKNKAKLKSQKVQLEQLRKSQRVKEMEEDGAKSKTEVHNSCVFPFVFFACLFVCCNDFVGYYSLVIGIFFSGVVM